MRPSQVTQALEYLIKAKQPLAIAMNNGVGDHHFGHYR